MSKISSVAEFWDPLQGARRAQSYESSCMRAQFLLCRRRFESHAGQFGRCL